MARVFQVMIAWKRLRIVLPRPLTVLRLLGALAQPAFPVPGPGTEPKATPDTSHTQHRRASAGLSSHQAGLPSAIRPCCPVAAPLPRAHRAAPTSPSPLPSGPVQQTPALQWPFRNRTWPFPRERRGPRAPAQPALLPCAPKRRRGLPQGCPTTPTPLPEVTGARCGPPWPGGVGCTVGRGGSPGAPGRPSLWWVHAQSPLHREHARERHVQRKGGKSLFCAQSASVPHTWRSQSGPSVVPPWGRHWPCRRCSRPGGQLNRGLADDGMKTRQTTVLPPCSLFLNCVCFSVYF